MRKFTTPETVTDEQVSAFSSFFAAELGGAMPAELSRAALVAVRETLVSGLGPVFAVNAACSVVYPGTDRPDLRPSRLVRVLNALLATEDGSGHLLQGPAGLLPLGLGMKGFYERKR